MLALAVAAINAAVIQPGASFRSLLGCGSRQKATHGIPVRRSSSEDLPQPEPQLSTEERAAALLFYRERGCVSVRRLAELEELPLALAETLLCRGLATLVARSYPAEWLCERFSASPEQLATAATAPPFGEGFRPLSLTWPQVGLPAPQRAEPPGADPGFSVNLSRTASVQGSWQRNPNVESTGVLPNSPAPGTYSSP
jgi:hypothetical protein